MTRWFIVTIQVLSNRSPNFKSRKSSFVFFTLELNKNYIQESQASAFLYIFPSSNPITLIINCSVSNLMPKKNMSRVKYFQTMNLRRTKKKIFSFWLVHSNAFNVINHFLNQNEPTDAFKLSKQKHIFKMLQKFVITKFLQLFFYWIINVEYIFSHSKVSLFFNFENGLLFS